MRRSVANNLNDISKDHPGIVFDVAQRWLGNNEDTDRLVKHGCRGLLKQGDARVMQLFGFEAPGFLTINKFQRNATVSWGGQLDFSFVIRTRNGKAARLRLEYAIGFLRKNGWHSYKVFKISELEASDSDKKVSKRHSFRAITTRQYYAGRHILAIIINGQRVAEGDFELLRS